MGKSILELVAKYRNRTTEEIEQHRLLAAQLAQEKAERQSRHLARQAAEKAAKAAKNKKRALPKRAPAKMTARQTRLLAHLRDVAERRQRRLQAAGPIIRDTKTMAPYHGDSSIDESWREQD